MNIFVPDSWLREHLETQATPEEIQKLLSLSGPSVERIHREKNEKVYEIEVTTNRMDSASVQGTAREAAVILSHSGMPSKLKIVESYKPKSGEVISNTKKFPVNIQN
ncbi:MAG TPA: hypothetical protein VFG51_01475, partial [Candidatus Saccharimonadia bacterium]|nr:hypothetical protein [Candidatus Saccharimonadia bacterium]